ncbi:MAG: hypothetical protein JWM41_194 [Gemmatimonadetes bacterium]|nr:hypothetical protein [Gemmatimonadota bacterium]
MTTFIGTAQRTTYTVDMPADVPPDAIERQQTLRQYLVAREKVRFFEEYVAAQQQQHFDDFVVNVMARRMYSTSCDLASSAAAEITAACSAFQMESNSMRHTVTTLGAVRQRLDEQIAAHVGVCGSAAACILDDHMAQVRSELTVTQTKRDDTQSWLDTLQALRVKAETPPETNGHQWATSSAGFGRSYSQPHVASRTNTDPVLVKETITEEFRDLRATTKEPANPLDADIPKPKKR